MMQHPMRIGAAIAVSAAVAGSASGQWDPANALWGESDPDHLRVMTWNVADTICRTARKTDEFNGWNAIVRIIADLQPDIWIVQEAGDNSGNGTGSGRDSVSQMTTTFELFLHGGFDPFTATNVGSYVQMFSPGYDLPYIYVSGDNSDSFNRMVILSRYPFADLNGDGTATYSDFALFASDAYATAGDGGIRGFAHAEIDLPDEVYAGDVVVGSSHLKAFGNSSDLAQRLRASQNIAYYIDYQYNGAGTGTPDPSGVIAGNPTAVLDANTPVIWGGDFNEDEDTNNRRGPAEWMTRAQVNGGTDGTDHDRTDSTFDTATNPISGETFTRGAQKLDYMCWQDSIATEIRSFVFNSGAPGMADVLPPAVDTFTFVGTAANSLASDHFPVVVDFQMPPATSVCPADWDENGTVNIFDILAYLDDWNTGDLAADLTSDGTLSIFDVLTFLSLFEIGCP